MKQRSRKNRRATCVKASLCAMSVINSWGMTPDATLNYPDADTNLDSTVDIYDLLLVISNWGSGG